MDKNRLNELNKAYEKACNDILEAFSKEYDVTVDCDCWLAGDCGTIACVNDEFYLNMEDIILMLREGVSWAQFLQWWDYNAEVGVLGLNGLNLRSWLRGAPRYKREQLDKLQALRKEIDELTEETIKDLEGY